MSITPICLPNNTNLLDNFDIESPFTFQTYKINGENDGNTDFIVLAEFSEIEGPVPLLVIPSNIKPFIEINELVMNLMSTDYQCRGSNEFRIWDCTSLTLLNHSMTQFIYSQYFILYDIRARGFVRPMCIAYCSTSLQKVLTYESKFETEISQAIEYLRICNLKMFKYELESRIKDLIYTKKRLLISERNAKQMREDSINDGNCTSFKSKPQNCSSHEGVTTTIQCLQQTEFTLSSSVGSCDSVHLSSIMFADSNEEMQDTDEQSALQHVTLESLATQMTDCQNIFRIVSDYLESSTLNVELEPLKSRISKPKCALHRFFNSSDPSSPATCYTPSVFAWSLVRRNYRNMRKIKDLCGIGYLACLLKLLNVLDTYSRPFSDLFFLDLENRHGFDHGGVGTLQMGLVSSEAEIHENIATFSLQDDHFDGKLTQMLTSTEKISNGSKNLIESYNSDINDNVSELVGIVESKISLQSVKNEELPQASPQNYIFVSTRLNTEWNILLERFGDSFKCILYSLLCGKTVIVAGPAAMEDKVSVIVDILASILPFYRRGNFPTLRWHMGLVTRYHVTCYRIIGACIPERLHLHELMSNDTLNKVTVLNVSTNGISGVAYYGKYLKTLICTRNKTNSAKSMTNSCFQTIIQSILMRFGRDGFLLIHLLATTTRSDDQILKGLGIHQGDWTAVKHISSLLKSA